MRLQMIMISPPTIPCYKSETNYGGMICHKTSCLFWDLHLWMYTLLFFNLEHYLKL